MAFGSMNSGDDAPMSDINVTPLVDVMLVLLIVFMITMPVLTHSIPLELPTASEKAAKQKEKQPKDPLLLFLISLLPHFYFFEIGEEIGN